MGQRQAVPRRSISSPGCDGTHEEVARPLQVPGAKRGESGPDHRLDVERGVAHGPPCERGSQ
jgi:hypothetical protein